MFELTTAIGDPLLRVFVAARAMQVSSLHKLQQDERGEGVISAAIAVLIMAFLGVAMWIAFQKIFKGASDNTESQVSQIGK